MKNSIHLLCTGLLIAGTLVTPVVAQTLKPETVPDSETSSEDNTFSIRGGIRYTTEGAGYKEGFTSFEGFFPLLQTPGKNLTFLEGRLLLQNDANLGANVVLGQRFFDASANRVYGGYIAYDNRNTDKSFFNQIGLGFETLGEDWDFRVNGYIPTGDTRQQVSRRFFSPFFQENFLLLNRDRKFEAAAAGFDAEFGGKLVRLVDGALRGYAGIYYINIEGGSDAVGVRGRLEARPTDYVTVNLSVQNDSIFDTRVVASVGLTFPGSSARGNGKKPRGLDRMGDSVVRQSAILVAEQTKIDQVPVLNPQTNQPYQFQHVNLGLGTGNGTFESPYGNVQDALNATRSDGNDIVYVQPGTNPGIPPFIIPDRVQVISTGPVQLLNTVQVGLVRLPLSRGGILPAIRPSSLPEASVILGNNTVLGGFTINGATGAGISGTNITNVTVRDNAIANSADRGISLSNVTGQVEVTNNVINQSSNPFSSGFAIANTAGSVDLRIRDNTMTNTTNNGIGINLTGTAQGKADLIGNTLSENQNDGVFIRLDNSAQGIFNISNNSIAQNQGRGITFEIRDTAQGETNIQNNTILSNRDNGVAIQLSDTAQATTNISNNTISGNGFVGNTGVAAPFNGIDIELFNSSTGTFNISSNTVSANQNDGIRTASFDSSQATFTISNNTISDNGLNGLEVAASGNSTSTVTIDNNQVFSSTRNGIFIDSKESSTTNATITNNTVSSSGLDGISTDTADNSFLQVLIQGNIATNNGRFGIEMTAAETSQLSAGVRLNTLTANPGVDGVSFGFAARTIDTSTMCLALRDNTSNNGFVLSPFSGTFNADASGNNVTPTQIGTINPLGSCSVP